MFLPGLRILIPGRIPMESWGREVYPSSTDGSKLGGCIGAGVFCKELGLEIHFRLNHIFQAEIFA